MVPVQVLLNAQHVLVVKPHSELNFCHVLIVWLVNSLNLDQLNVQTVLLGTSRVVMDRVNAKLVQQVKPVWLEVHLVHLVRLVPHFLKVLDHPNVKIAPLHVFQDPTLVLLVPPLLTLSARIVQRVTSMKCSEVNVQHVRWGNLWMKRVMLNVLIAPVENMLQLKDCPSVLIVQILVHLIIISPLIAL
jgi:hypothetical protein